MFPAISCFLSLFLLFLSPSSFSFARSRSFTLFLPSSSSSTLSNHCLFVFFFFGGGLLLVGGLLDDLVEDGEYVSRDEVVVDDVDQVVAVVNRPYELTRGASLIVENTPRGLPNGKRFVLPHHKRRTVHDSWLDYLLAGEDTPRHGTGALHIRHRFALLGREKRGTTHQTTNNGYYIYVCDIYKTKENKSNEEERTRTLALTQWKERDGKLAISAKSLSLFSAEVKNSR